MTTNKYGTVNQQPLYCCTSCYEHCTWPAGDLRVYGNECWCTLCWDVRLDDFPGQPEWADLKPYTPALQAEGQRLQAECERLREQSATLAEALESLMKGYASLLEGGIDRITHLDGDCHLISDMLRGAQEALAAQRKGGDV